MIRAIALPTVNFIQLHPGLQRMIDWPKIKLGDILLRSTEPAVIDLDTDYHEVTIRLWGKGIVSRGKVRGSDVGTVRRVVRTNQLILSKIDARSGAIGLVPPELDGAIVSNDFPSFEFRDVNQCDPQFMAWFVRSTYFINLCKSASEGTTNRVRIKEDRFLNQQIGLPSLSKQQALVAQFNTLADKVRQINEHLDAIEADAERLLAVRFQDAINAAPHQTMAEVAPLVRRNVVIDLNTSYTELGLRSFYKGTFQRRIMNGADYSWQELYWVQAGDLIFSNIMAWEQAIAIAKPEDNGTVGNHRMLTCSTNIELMIPGFLWYYFTTAEGFAKIEAASPGTAARNKTLTAQALLAIQVPVPDLTIQSSFDDLQSKVIALKAKHAVIRAANQVLVPATLERLFSEA